jgi:hypothetical protein
MTRIGSAISGWPVAVSLLSAVGWAICAVVAAPSAAPAQGMPASLAEFLQQTIAATPNELNGVDGGAPLVRIMEPADRRELAVVGIIRIAVLRSFYVARASDFPTALRDSSRLHLGLFSNPAAASDVAEFGLPHDDVKDLVKCRAGSCKVKLSAPAIEQLQTMTSASPQSADSIASAFFREQMVNYITHYRAKGDQALIVYGDQDSTSSASRIYGAMLERSPYLYRYAPTLERYLKQFPQDRPAIIREVLFWSEEVLPSLKPTLTLDHEVVYSPPELPGCTLIATKQLYADHYFDGGLTLNAAVDAETKGANPPGLYLVTVRRLHFDDLPSGGLMNVRGKAMGKLREGTASSLKQVKAQTERAWTLTHSATP